MTGHLKCVVVALGLMLTGCAMAQDVKLRHPDGRVVTCEPGWRYGVLGATLGQDQARPGLAGGDAPITRQSATPAQPERRLLGNPSESRVVEGKGFVGSPLRFRGLCGSPLCKPRHTTAPHATRRHQGTYPQPERSG
jgi:hypothetical protein